MAYSLSLTNLQTALSQNNTKMKEWVNTQIGNLKIFNITWVDELPTENISINTIYMVKSTTTTEGTNIYDECVYNETTSKWESLGSVDCGNIDLSDYYNKTETYSKEEVDTLLNGITLENYTDEDVTNMITTIWSE